jgi:hypothetical protein
MNTGYFQLARRVLAITVALIVIAQLLAAQDIERPTEAPNVPPRGPIMIGRQGFDLQASGRLVGDDELRERYETALKSRLENTVRLYGLSNEQKKKLLLAGRGDIKRLLDRAFEERNRGPLPWGAENEFAANAQDDPPPRFASSGALFGEGSLFAKTLKTTVTMEQSVRYEKTRREASLRQHRATLQWVLGTWDQMLALNSEQHRRLEALLIRETRPPRRFGEEDYFGVLVQISRLPEATFKPIFSNDQWAKLSVQLAEAKRREPILKKAGYVPENDVAAVPAQTNDTSATRKNEQG